jgi:hypothetical protein
LPTNSQLGITFLFPRKMYSLTHADLIHWRGRYGPAWRHITARNSAGSSRRLRIADWLTVDVRRYLSLDSSGGDSANIAATVFPRIAEAFRAQKDRQLVDSLRIMILGRLDIAEIIARTGLSKTILRLWRAIFFDVNLAKDPLGWQLNHVVWPELDAGNLQVGGNLHTARCFGPHVARRLLDGPTKVPTSAKEDAKLALEQARIASLGLLLSYSQSDKELQQLPRLVLRMQLQEQTLALKEKRLAARLVKEERNHDLAERRARIAEERAKAESKRRVASAKSKAAKAQAKADKLTEDQKLRLGHQEQAAALEKRELAERRARIAASGLLKLSCADRKTKAPANKATEHPASASPASTASQPIQTPSGTSPRQGSTHVAPARPKVVLAPDVVGHSQDFSLAMQEALSP